MNMTTPQSVQKEKIKQIIYEHSYHAGMAEDIEEGQIIGFKTGKSGELDDVADAIEAFIYRISASVREETIEKCAVIAWRTGMDLYMKEIDVREVGAKAAHNIRNLFALQELSGNDETK